MDFANI